MNGLGQTLRQLARSPGFALTVTLFLGVSVAALLALTGTAWTLLAKPLPYPDGERLVSVHGWSEKMGFPLGFPVPLAERLSEFEQVEAVGLYRDGDELEDESGTRLPSVRINAELQRMLAVRPLLGRLPTGADDADSVMISETLWQNRFSRDPGVLARPLELPGHRLRVIGVLPRGFGFPRLDTAVWQTLRLSEAERAPEQIGNWGDVQVYARLEHGTSAVALADAITARWGAMPELAAMREFMGLGFRVEPLRDHLSRGDPALLDELLLATGLVLLAQAANLANLWLGRTLARRRELAVRVALGAGGWRSAAPVLAEIVTLTVAGVAFGLALVPVGLQGFRHWGAWIPPHRWS